MRKFSLQRQDEPYVEATLVEASGRDYAYPERPDPATIPVGSVDWCQEVYGARTPDYYPDWARSHLHRRIWTECYDEAACYDSLFVKPARAYKLFDGTVGAAGVAAGEPIWCSERVEFEHEWRYYIARGRVCASAWYEGRGASDDDVVAGNVPSAPELPPELARALAERAWCGALDMGLLRVDGGAPVLALVEACHPYGVGWYPDDADGYIDFLEAGDAYLRMRAVDSAGGTKKQNV